MCFFTEKKYEKAKIAKKSIVVWKVGDKTRVGFKSDCQNFKYVRGKKYSIKKFGRQLDMISEGFHSYDSKRIATLNRCGGSAFRMIIPRGTKYHHNKEFNEYVSLAIYYPKKRLSPKKG